MTPIASRSPGPCASRAAPPPLTRVFPPQTLTAAHDQARDELLFELLAARRPRSNARAVKRKMSNYSVKHPEHRDPPRPDQTIIVLAA